LLSSVIVIGAWAIGRSRRVLALGMTLALAGVSMQWTAVLASSGAAFAAAGLLYTVLLGIMIGEVLRYLLKREPVTADKLHGAMAGYLMMALLWAFLYALLDYINPGSFNSAQLDFTKPGTFFHLIYFSFTVLTTVGFGDVTPATDKARSLVMLEEIAGVFFVGVLIARLAGLYPQEPPKRSP
jgi:hypothetical protein